MPEYSYEDIIIDPNDPRLEGAIGKECYFSDNPKLIIKRARENSSTNLYCLTKIRKNSYYPFTIGRKCTLGWSLIIIKKEEPKLN